MGKTMKFTNATPQQLQSLPADLGAWVAEHNVSVTITDEPHAHCVAASLMDRSLVKDSFHSFIAPGMTVEEAIKFAVEGLKKKCYVMPFGQRVKFDIPSSADELQFVDADIRAAFEGKTYTNGTPTMAQLSRNVRARTTIDDVTYRQPLERLVGKTCHITWMPDAALLPNRTKVGAVDGCMIELIRPYQKPMWVNMACIRNIQEAE